jgi:hypothetical protein
LPNDAPHISLTPFCFRKEVKEQNTPEKDKVYPNTSINTAKRQRKTLIEQSSSPKDQRRLLQELVIPGCHLAAAPIQPIILVFFFVLQLQSSTSLLESSSSVQLLS